MIERLRVRVSDPAGIVGGGSECTALSSPSIPQQGALEQGTNPQLLQVCVHSVCMCVQCCMCEHRMG